MPAAGFAPGAAGTFTYMAPETLCGRSTPASDVYGIGLMMYELFTGGGPHLTAPWTTGDKQDHTEEHCRIKRRLRFAPPSEAHNEIRFDYRWLDGLILRCLEVEPRRRFADAGELLAVLVACESGGELPPEPGIDAGPDDEERDAPPKPRSARLEELVCEVRRLLARREFEIWAIFPDDVLSRTAAVSTSPAAPICGSIRQEPTAWISTASSPSRKRAMSRS